MAFQIARSVIDGLPTNHALAVEQRIDGRQAEAFPA
jgi:hypothetical protein